MVILNYLEDLWLSNTHWMSSTVRWRPLSAYTTGFQPYGSAVLFFVFLVLLCRRASSIWPKAKKQNFP